MKKKKFKSKFLIFSLDIVGVAIGSGWQDLVAYVNLAAYYLVGLPIGCVLGFKTSLGVAVSWKYFKIKLRHFNLYLNLWLKEGTHTWLYIFVGHVVGHDCWHFTSNIDSYHSYSKNRLGQRGNRFNCYYQINLLSA